MAIKGAPDRRWADVHSIISRTSSARSLKTMYCVVRFGDCGVRDRHWMIPEGGWGGGGVRVTRGDGRRQFLWATEDISAGAAAARRNNVALRASHYKRDTVAAMRRKAFISAPCPTR